MPETVTLSEVSIRPIERFSTGFPNVDDVLGGGIVRGSTMLLAGPPGVGKTTLIMQCARGVKALIGGGEQTPDYLRLYASRIGCPEILVSERIDGDVEALAAEAAALKVELLVLETLQTAWLADVAGDVGSIKQVRAITERLTRFAHESGAAVILVCHYTKAGDIAGPADLEHSVDTVARLDPLANRTTGNYTNYRLLSIAEKHRYGKTPAGTVLETLPNGALRRV